MHKLLPGLLAIAVIAAPITLAVAPANADTAQAAPAPAQADDSSPTPGVESVETDTAPAGGNGPTTLEESAQDQLDASPSTLEPPQASPTTSPNRTTASNSGPASVATLAATPTQILAPADASEVAGGYVGYTVQVATAGDYWLDLDCDQNYTYESLSASYDGQQFTGSIGPVSAGDNCRLDIYGSYGSSGTGEDVAFFSVERPVVVPEVRNPVAGPETFYPRVRDGFRDHTDIGFGARQDSDVTVKILAGGGSPVRTFTRDGRAWADYYERRWVTWNGKNTAGNLVPTGRYTAVITSTIDGRSDTSRVPIWVASGHRTVRVTRTKDGWYDSIDQTRGNCYAWEVSDGNDLDCWGGRFAQATYRFSLPSNARNIDWGVRGYQECCSDGRITKTGERASARSFRIAVRVTNWRSYVVRSTWVTYTYRKAI